VASTGGSSSRLTAAQHISRFVIKAYARWVIGRRCRVKVVGLDYLPRSGPVLLAARHYHNLYDATSLLSLSPRPLHFLVALDWAQTPRRRWLLERACRLAVWPGLLRGDRLPRSVGTDPLVWRQSDVEPYSRRSIIESAALLAAGRALVVFPEGSPVIDPERPPRASDSLLPFRHGFVAIARRAARTFGRPVPVVPVGLEYRRHGRRWLIDVRLGASVPVDADADRDSVAREVEASVRRLSGL
jgi:1-acyl-sn-glycerol-3-phosphate acyltransferase